MFGFGKKKRQKLQEKALQKELAEAEKIVKKEESKTQESPVDPKEKKKKSRTDKLVMGAIMGVAVGSVVGMSLRSKTEHEQEQEKPFLSSTNKNSEQPAEPRSRLFRFFKRVLSIWKGKKQVKPKKEKTFFKKIPNEWE